MLKPRPIYELLDYEFHIPAYQRGYRWDVEQVEALLNDLKHFIKQTKSPAGVDSAPKYYCLQPVAVVTDAANKKSCHVVDGQQRLTTLYLLMQYLRPNSDYEMSTIFTLRMDAREEQQHFIDDELYRKADHAYISNIDNFYLKTAYDTIIAWFAKENPKIRQSFRELLMMTPDEDDTPEQIDSMRNVRVIWYEMEGVKARDAFRRLNYGKIPLTATELVKALLLQKQDAYEADAFRQSGSYRKAIEWDTMERTLQNPYLWSMLSDNSEQSLSHLDLILDFVADDLNRIITTANGGQPLFVRKEKELIASDKDARDYFNYNVVEHVISANVENAPDPLEAIWDRIRKVFNLITNWYDNRDWYHLIGLLRILPKKQKPQREFVRDIYMLSVNNEGEPIDRPLFTKRLMRRISNVIPPLPEGKTLKQLRYNEDDDVMRAILKALNVKTAMDDSTEGARFAFYLFDKYNPTSLEHIHPQKISLDSMDYEKYCTWFIRRCEDLNLLTDADYMRVACRSLSRDELDKITDEAKKQDMYESKKAEIALAKENIHRIISSKRSFDNDENRPILERYTKTLDSLFGDLTGVTEGQLHSISNMTLVDKDTNAALQNYFLDRKRDLLMDRHTRGVAGQENGTYAMPSTRKVYNKDYSRQSPGDMRFWRIEDRDNYFEEIKNVIGFFTNID